MSAVTLLPRVISALAGPGLLVAVWFSGAHWVDVGDETCGGVYRPDMWLNDDACRNRMLLRSTWVVAMFVVALALIYMAVRARPRRRA
jgi:hypothetical protein